MRFLGAAAGIVILTAASLSALPRAGTRAQDPGHRIDGRVVDVSGAPVAGATVVVDANAAPPIVLNTADDGRFVAPGLPIGFVTVRASAPGFADATVTFRIGPDEPAPLQIVLRPSPFTETVSVTATRGAAGLKGPAGVSVVTSGDLASSPAGPLDDALRGTPGFSLFRRSSSRVANPTTQGVTLRGISGSGASRTLVVADGVPLNDPFGSWVYWARVPMAAIDRVEVVRGASSDLYGADALGGVIQILTFPPGRARVRAVVDGGSHGTVRGSGFASAKVSDWTFAGAAEGQNTAGVPVVARDERGAIDVPAYSRYRTGFASIDVAASGWRYGVRGSAQSEHRGNGTPAQRNDTTWRQMAASLAGPGAGGLWTVQGAAGSQTFSQTFSAVNPSRSSEQLTSEQRIPTTFVTASGLWTRILGRHSVLIGAEARHVKASLRETRYSLAGTPLEPTVTGGSETSGALFARVSLAPVSSVSADAGVRADLWRTTPRDTRSGTPPLASVGPRLSVAWRPRTGLAAHAALYQAYRTPTLNELYRGFRVGNVVTNSNPRLRPEHLTGVEGGVLLGHTIASARITAFYSRLADAVTNVTILTTPAQVFRERQNTDTVRATGVELEVEARPLPSLSVSGLAVLTASRFVRTPAQPGLAGNRVPQVPRYQFGGSVTWTDPRLATIVLHARAWGSQFDDDQNLLELRRYATADVSASRTLAATVHVFVAVENLFDVEYDVGRTPVRTIGWPRSVRAGARFYFP